MKFCLSCSIITYAAWNFSRRGAYGNVGHPTPWQRVSLSSPYLLLCKGYRLTPHRVISRYWMHDVDNWQSCVKAFRRTSCMVRILLIYGIVEWWLELLDLGHTRPQRVHPSRRIWQQLHVKTRVADTLVLYAATPLRTSSFRQQSNSCFPRAQFLAFELMTRSFSVPLALFIILAFWKILSYKHV